MKLTHYGTAAAEGWPALWCNCESCKTARARGGKNIRSRSQSLVNDDLLIDFPPDTYMHTVINGLDLNPVKNVLITHSHGDHLLETEFGYRMEKMFCGVHEDYVLNVYCSKDVMARCKKTLRGVNEAPLADHVMFHELTPFTEYQIGDYKVYPMLADHALNEECLIYAIISPDGKQLLYANDTGYFPRATWEFILEKGFSFDLVSLDCTAGALVGWWTGHMNYDACDAVKDRLLKCGNAREDTHFIWNHFSHNCAVLGYEEMVEDAKAHNFDCSYDGKVTEV